MERVFFNGDPKIESEERKSRSIEDTKINYKNQIRERQNHLPTLLEEKYHIMNNVDNKIGAGTSCIVKKIKSNDNNDHNIYAAALVTERQYEYVQRRS